MSFAARTIPLWSGSRPVLDLAFARGIYSSNGANTSLPSAIPGWSFTRASTGAAVNSAGTVLSFASGQPRITDLGLLVEESRTNLALWSQDFSNAAWVVAAAGVASNPTVTANFATAPDGTQTASRLQFTLGGGTTTTDRSRVLQTIATTNGSTYSVSVWLKANTGAPVNFIFRDASSALGGAVTVTSAWQRFTFSGVASASTVVDLELRGAQAPANPNTADILAWGGQLELGAFPTSYIPTTSATATRAADVASVTIAGPASGTLIGSAFVTGLAAVRQTIAGLDDGTVNNATYLQFNAPSPNLLANVTTGGVSQLSGSFTWASATGVTQKEAIAWASADFAASAGGQAVQTASSGTVPTTTVLRLGDTAAGTRTLNGYLGRVVLYPTRLPNASLVSMTQ